MKKIRRIFGITLNGQVKIGVKKNAQEVQPPQENKRDVTPLRYEVSLTRQYEHHAQAHNNTVPLPELHEFFASPPR
ncbi:MAG: hypothetical protein ACRC10_01410, partial [Thermoguttaceae bacterium]